MRRPSPLRRHLPEQRERRAHRGRIGVVALVDQQHRAARHVERDALAAPDRRLQLGERERRERQVGAEQLRRREHAERIVDHVPAGRAELVGDVVAENARLHGRGLGLQRDLQRAARRRLRVRRTRRSARCPAAARRPVQPLELRDIGIDHRGAARLDAGEDLRLRVRDGIERAEEFQMHRRDRGDDRHMRTHQRGQRRDLARMVHADLEHAELRRAAASARARAARPSDCCRRPPTRASRLAAEHEAQRLLGAGLADRAGHRDDLRAPSARARRARDRSAPRAHPATTSSGASFGIAACLPAATTASPRARLQARPRRNHARRGSRPGSRRTPRPA